MSGVRLYIGGLGESVDEGVLKGHLATYGTVVNVAVKEKKDAEGIVMTRFAYVNLEASNIQINQCVNKLNGSVWKGSRLKVERARESFMERLQRERAANNQQQPIRSREVPVKDTQIKQSQQSFKPVGQQVNKRPLLNTEQRNTDLAVKKTKVDDSSSGSSVSDSSDDSSDEECNGIPMFRGTASIHLDNENEKQEKSVNILNEKNKPIQKEDLFKSKNKEKNKYQGDSGLFKDSKGRSKDKVEEALLSNFKSFSSVWGDSDDEDDNDEEDSADDEDDADDASSEPGNEEKTKKSEEPGFFIDLQPAKTSTLQSGVMHNKSNSVLAIEDMEEDLIGDVVAERQAQLDILSNILGKPMTVTENKTDDKKGQHMKRYDPTLPEHKQYEVRREQQQQQKMATQESEKTDLSKQTDSIEHKLLGQNKYIKVSQNLNFKEKSEGFSLLSMFSQKKTESSGETEEEEDEEEEEEEEEESAEMVVESAQIQKKKTKFFLQEHDSVIDQGIQWLSQSLTQEICEEFDKIRPELVQVYKTRMVRAKRDAKSSRGRGRGRTRVPLRDNRQESKPNENKNFSKDRNPQENSGVLKNGQFNSKRKFEGRGRGLGRGRGRGHIQGKG